MTLHKLEFPNDLKDSNEMRLFELLVELLNEPVMTRAAASIGISASGASRLLSRARLWFDDELFVRSAGRMSPTKRMLELEPRLRALLASVERVFESQAVFRPSEVQASVRIAANDNAFFTVIAPVIPILRREAPGLRIHVFDRSPDILAKMRDGELDLAVYSPEKTGSPKDFIERPLFHSDHVTVVRREHPLVSRFKEKGFLLPEETAPYQHATAQVTMANGFGPVSVAPNYDESVDDVVCSAPHFLSMVSVVLTTDLLLRLPRETAVKLRETVPLAVLPLERGVSMPWKPSLYWHRSTADSPLLTWLRAHITTQAMRTHDAAVRAVPLPCDAAAPIGN